MREILTTVPSSPVPLQTALLQCSLLFEPGTEPAAFDARLPVSRPAPLASTQAGLLFDSLWATSMAIRFPPAAAVAPTAFGSSPTASCLDADCQRQYLATAGTINAVRRPPVVVAWRCEKHRVKGGACFCFCRALSPH